MPWEFHFKLLLVEDSWKVACETLLIGLVQERTRIRFGVNGGICGGLTGSYVKYRAQSARIYSTYYVMIWL